MKDEKETKNKLIKSAMKEFVDKGYRDASLRNICRDAGVTTGALYFFFQNKDDLFSAIVDEPIRTLYGIMMSHYAYEAEEAKGDSKAKEDFADDLESARKALHYMYENYDVFLLILTKSQGSKYEYLVDDFVDITEKHYRSYSNQMTNALGQNPIDDYMLHWMSHAHIDIFVHMITHERDEKDALKYMEQTVRYMIGGWRALLKM